MLVDLKQTHLMSGNMSCWIINCVIIKFADLETDRSRFWKSWSIGKLIC
jgi:hypothetical protein